MELKLPNTMIIFLLMVNICLVGCKKKEVEKEEPQVEIPFTSHFILSELSASDNFSPEGIPVGTVDLKEVSGLAESRVNPNSLWAHNDAGNEKILYLLDKNTGAVKAGYFLNGTNNRDWEDIEVGPGPDPGKSYVYLADIGDNNQVFSTQTIYRFEEPLFEEEHRDKVIGWTGSFDAMHFSYPDGPKDSETLLLDHNTKDLYILTKRDFPAKLYLYKYPQATGSETTIVMAGTLPILAPVGGNVSFQGDEILIKDYGTVFHWEHDIEKPLYATLAKQPTIAPYNPVETQGEAVCFYRSEGYFTLSEKGGDKEVFLYFYERLK